MNKSVQHFRRKKILLGDNFMLGGKDVEVEKSGCRLQAVTIVERSMVSSAFPSVFSPEFSQFGQMAVIPCIRFRPGFKVLILWEIFLNT